MSTNPYGNLSSIRMVKLLLLIDALILAILLGGCFVLRQNPQVCEGLPADLVNACLGR
jgi:hypothetical protein